MTCICHGYELYRWKKHTFEAQTVSFTCGPIAIINALRFARKPVGPAVHRQIMVGCNPKFIHADGFKGTKPNDMERMIRRFWPTAERSTGLEACQRALALHTACILLYQRTPLLQHYIFVHSDKAGYHLENDADGSLQITDMLPYLTSKKSEPIAWILV